ncbi:nucleic acid-binding protein [Karstenula rhodostoma CBS 690.94]|uniref:Nucleic acid-binding protein n=1 Tax=Karstenula rhodostoma CBS 690.94 TaxID=1392251 RepID=A0A9P4PMY9_9PLEO|nr:nucleic acid-binding protein [Karstenula rhodostoma CBS 690.94]
MSKSLAGKPIVRKLFSSSQVGVVVSAGRMSKAVKVRIAAQEWNKKFRKHFPSEQNYLVADPNSSLVEGDVVRIASGWRTSKSIRHVVTSIVSPFGEPVENRPPILSDEERMQIRIKERLLKDVRSAAKGRQTSLQRLAEARRQKLQIPSLEEAMANVRIAEQQEKAGKNEAHKGHTGQAETRKERRIEAGRERKQEKKAEAQVKRARAQTV